MRKKLFGIFMALVMVVALMPERAWAGGSHDHNSIHFDYWSETDKLPTNAGNFYLSKDIILAETWTVPAGTEGSPAVTNLCLNGHVIKVSEESVAGKDYGMNVIIRFLTMQN